MGTNTAHLNLYKPDGSELVDVGSQINENFDKLDASANDLDSRVGAVEGVSGVASWKTFVPTLFDTDTIIISGGTNRTGRCFKIGNLAFVTVSVDAGSALSGGVVGSPRIFVQLPYKATEPRFMEGSGRMDLSGNLVPLLMFNSADYNMALFGPVLEIGDGNFIKQDTTTDINWGSVTGNLYFNFWYSTTGEALVALT